MSEPARTPPDKPAETPPVVVKKYANRRLYNTESSSYITLDNLAEMIRKGRDFVVYDAKSGEDITRGVLTQIIVEEEGKGRAMLPTSFLRHLIGFYGDSVQNLVPRYLEQSMAAFAHQQQQVRAAMQQTMGSFFPFGNMEEINRQNMAMMERAMNLFTPFPRHGEGSAGGDAVTGRSPTATEQEISRLQSELESLHRQLAQALAAHGEAKALESAGSEPASASVTPLRPATPE
ncbi:MAG: polyhydroxyalkanoate synthesis repressor PhaR [Acetobacteraceae bacterium]|nr:polyhydroxyalkanoate synthesis repressor PhaR [Acetobacteraceae bacterium]